ncbi:hypothetical protein [Brevundimonas lenta]|uniref:Uncharacterized protein YraI n=1 Tax=Brevundimonas lenta TaxID=424796 RepID=A0A7W6JBQ9_9CAUL|nr:hypothetical protein [Brevundimonas lenta]MBB4082195.1 uncharacterized protein YraI [Brevundimonas lenta]
MKKVIAAVTAGLLLVAGQAVAANQATSVARVGDRVGPRAEASSEFGGIPIVGILAIAGIIAATIVVVGGDDSDSD